MVEGEGVAVTPQDDRVLVARIKGRELLLTLAIWLVGFAAIVLPVVIAARWLRVPFLRHHLADVSAALMLAGYLALLVALLVAFRGARGLRDRLGFHFTSWLDILGAVALWMVTLLAGVAVAAVVQRFFGSGPSNALQLLERSRDPLYLALVLPTTLLLAPALEEMLFRGALYGWLRTRLHWVFAAVVSAAIFAAAHRLPLLFPPLFLFGLSAAYLYQRTGSTLNTFVMHASQNTLAIVVTYALISRGSA